MYKKILHELENDARLTPKTLSEMFGISVDEVEKILADCEKKGYLLGYRAEVNWDAFEDHRVEAFIELKITPQRERGFDAIAERISNFPEVKSVYLMSGGFDLCVLIEAKTMRDVAFFVSERLATIEGINSTATHFVLQRYKDNGTVFTVKQDDKRGNSW